MELGRIAEIDNAKSNHIKDIQIVREISDGQKIIQDDKYKKAQGKTETKEANEVILDNVKFGYNRSSKDFFIKVTRGNIEYKYPTEDMMRVKAQILKEMEK